MNFETLREQARNWRENQEAGSERELGYVVIFNGQIVGWKRELDNPQGWEPGCLVVGIAGSVYQAEGGNAYDGARVWQRLDLANPTLHEDAFTTAHMAAPEKLEAVRQALLEALALVSEVREISASASAHTDVHNGLCLSSVLTERAVPVSLTVTDQDRLLVQLEARLADEMGSLVDALLKFGRITQRISVELPNSSEFGKQITLFLSLFCFQFAAALLKDGDAPLLLGDGAELLNRLGLNLDDLFRELNLNGRRFLAIALSDEHANQIINTSKEF